MPVLAFFAMVAFALIALLFVADATLEGNSPVIVTNNRVGLWARNAASRRHDTNSHHRASTRARHEITGGTCCSAQVVTQKSSRCAAYPLPTEQPVRRIFC